MTYQYCTDTEIVAALSGLADGQDDDMGQLLTEAARRIQLHRFAPGTAVRFTYLHGETCDGIVSSTNHRNVFVRFNGNPQPEACDPDRLTLLDPS